MTLRLLLPLALIACSLAGCDPKAASSAAGTAAPPAKPPAVDDHDHGPGPHGGTILEFGKFHGELTINHDKKECTVYILAANAKDSVAVACKELLVLTEETKTKDGKVVPKMTIKLLPKDEMSGKASVFVGTDPGLEHHAEHKGTVSGEIDGKPTKDKFEEK